MKDKSGNPMQRVAAIIGARGGSKELPRKNIENLNGKPLIAWTIEAAKYCELIDRVIVSTEDEEIAYIAKKWGAETPFLRPRELAEDTVPSIAFLQHAVQWLEEEDKYPIDIVVYMQVTDVFRKKGLVDEVVRRLWDRPELDTVFVGYPTHKNFWRSTKTGYERLNVSKDEVRQVKEVIFREDTGIACATRTSIVKSGRRIGKAVDIVINDDFYSSIDIHENSDMKLAETILGNNLYKLNK